MILNDLNHLNHFSIDETRFQSYMFPNMSPPWGCKRAVSLDMSKLSSTKYPYLISPIHNHDASPCGEIPWLPSQTALDHSEYELSRDCLNALSICWSITLSFTYDGLLYPIPAWELWYSDQIVDGSVHPNPQTIACEF